MVARGLRVRSVDFTLRVGVEHVLREDGSTWLANPAEPELFVAPRDTVQIAGRAVAYP